MNLWNIGSVKFEKHWIFLTVLYSICSAWSELMKWTCVTMSTCNSFIHGKNFVICCFVLVNSCYYCSIIITFPLSEMIGIGCRNECVNLGIPDTELHVFPDEAAADSQGTLSDVSVSDLFQVCGFCIGRSISASLLCTWTISLYDDDDYVVWT